MIDYVAIVSILSSMIIAISALAYNYCEHKSKKDFEARKEAKNYYMELYGYTAILHELAGAYQSSLAKGKAKSFTFKKCEYVELTSQEILDEFNKSYSAFSSFYIKSKCKGYEIFVSDNLKEKLTKFWINAKSFHENNALMKDQQEVKEFRKSAEETTEEMEKLFGLK